MKAMTFDKSFAEKKDTFANLIANLSRMVLTTSERLLYIKLLTRGFRSTPIYTFVEQPHPTETAWPWDHPTRKNYAGSPKQLEGGLLSLRTHSTKPGTTRNKHSPSSTVLMNVLKKGEARPKRTSVQSYEHRTFRTIDGNAFCLLPLPSSHAAADSSIAGDGRHQTRGAGGAGVRCLQELQGSSPLGSLLTCTSKLLDCQEK